GLAGLPRAGFEGPVPDIQVDGGTVAIQYRRFAFFRWGGRAEIALNAAIPWRVELRGGASRLDADLRGLRLLGIELIGGASEIIVRVPAPAGRVPVRVTGGASAATLRP